MLVRGLSAHEIQRGRFNVNAEDIRNRFKSLDLDGDGHITADELFEVVRRVSSQVVRPLTCDEVENKNGDDTMMIPTMGEAGNRMAAQPGIILLRTFFMGNEDKTNEDNVNSNNNNTTSATTTTATTITTTTSTTTATDDGAIALVKRNGNEMAISNDAIPNSKRRRMNDDASDKHPAMLAQATTNETERDGPDEDERMRHFYLGMADADSLEYDADIRVIGGSTRGGSKIGGEAEERERERGTNAPANNNNNNNNPNNNNNNNNNGDQADRNRGNHDELTAANDLMLRIPSTSSIEEKGIPQMRRQLSAGSEAMRETLTDLVGWTTEVSLLDYLIITSYEIYADITLY